MRLPAFAYYLALIFLTQPINPATANTREPDPGFLDDTLCTVAVVGMVSGVSVNNTLLFWPHGSCCTTTDCELQKISCPSPSSSSSGGSGANADLCCYKASGKGSDAGVCRCGINDVPQGTCF